MLEHVGRHHYPALGAVIDRCLHRGHGRGLLHFIGRNRQAPTGAWVSRYIFPGAYLPSLREVLQGVIEPIGLSVTDVENLRLHYARTLAMWLERFDAARDVVRSTFDEQFERMWRYYLATAQAGFVAGNLQLFQVTFARAFDNTLPLTRAALYR
jgi:cyclopropane-fatty-acyl-phospholipid synthase